MYQHSSVAIDCTSTCSWLRFLIQTQWNPEKSPLGFVGFGCNSDIRRRENPELPYRNLLLCAWSLWCICKQDSLPGSSIPRAVFLQQNTFYLLWGWCCAFIHLWTERGYATLNCGTHPFPANSFRVLCRFVQKVSWLSHNPLGWFLLLSPSYSAKKLLCLARLGWSFHSCQHTAHCSKTGCLWLCTGTLYHATGGTRYVQGKLKM